MSIRKTPEFFPHETEYVAEKVVHPVSPVAAVFPKERISVSGRVYQAAKMGLVGPHPEKSGQYVAYMIAQPEVTVGASKASIYSALFNASSHVLGALDFYRLQCEGNQNIDPNKGDRIATLQTLAIGALNLASGQTDYQETHNRSFQQQNALDFIHAPHHSSVPEWNTMLRQLLEKGGLDGIEVQVLTSEQLKSKLAYTISQIQLPDAVTRPFFSGTGRIPAADSMKVAVPQPVTTHENFAVAHAFVTRVQPRLEATNIDADHLLQQISQNALAGENVGETLAASAGIRRRKHR